jgi:hypothetical protein
MRINSTPMDSIPVNPYNAATEKTVTARRSTQLRKKLAKRAAGARLWEGLDKASMIGRWMNGGKSPASATDQHHASAAGQESKIK